MSHFDCQTFRDHVTACLATLPAVPNTRRRYVEQGLALSVMVRGTATYATRQEQEHLALELGISAAAFQRAQHYYDAAKAAREDSPEHGSCEARSADTEPASTPCGKAA